MLFFIAFFLNCALVIIKVSVIFVFLYLCIFKKIAFFSILMACYLIFFYCKKKFFVPF